MKSFARTWIVLWHAAMALWVYSGTLAASPVAPITGVSTPQFVTNVAQFRNISGADYLAGCNFRLDGVVTLIDADRDLVVLQDASGAVALNFPLKDKPLQVGQLVTLNGTNCSPYFARFPDYPYRPSGWDVQNSFEVPMNRDEYYLTRMRGLLHPPATGMYSFWVASDNSSELWLSPDADPSKARKIAFISRFDWVDPHEWSKFTSQHSDPILLKAGETYYIEALQEQTTEGSHLSVAWQYPLLGRSIIDGRYLTPTGERRDTIDLATKGILREYWTNYSAGDLIGLGGARTFESMLTVKKIAQQIHGPGQWPKPDRIRLGQRLRIEDNFRWVEAEGIVKFKGAVGDVAFLDLSDGQAVVQVRLLHWSPEMLKRLGNAAVRVEGVCEGVFDQNGSLTPGRIWASTENCISFLGTATTNVNVTEQPAHSMPSTNLAMRGFYGTRGVVTFNDRVFDKDYIFVQEDTAAVLITLGNRPFRSQLKVGQDVDLGGMLEPGKYVPVITPLFVTELGWRSMPLPITQPLGPPYSGNRDGRWSELEGVVHSANSNGTLAIATKEGSAYLWVGQTSSNYLARCVDAKLRARGVLLRSLLDAPVLLVPSRSFVDVEEEAPEDPFAGPRRSIADLLQESAESSWNHRVRVVGEITYRDSDSFFIQDITGGIRVRSSHLPPMEIGQTVGVLAFPTLNDFSHILTEALIRPANPAEHVKSKALDLSDATSPKQSGTLIHVNATLLAQKTNAMGHALELQEQQRVFVATLAASQGNLPKMLPGSRLQVTGVCDDETVVGTLTSDKFPRTQVLTSLNILLRNPQDVTVLSRPPWWTLRRTVALVGTLLTVLVVTLLWVHLLRRRLERQQAARLAFSRQVLTRLEDERHRIAVNLHDSLGQILLAIKTHTLLAIQRPPDEQGLRQRLDEISSATSQAIEEIRQITHGLRPYQLDRLGLTQAIRASVARASENNSILFATRVEDIDGLFDKDAEIHIYRIVQEAVTNVVKHSTATEAAVVIKKRTAVVSLSIRDNGRGFDRTKPSADSHDLGYGLSGIAERVRILGGTLTIDSRPGDGTSLTIEVPLANS